MRRVIAAIHSGGRRVLISCFDPRYHIPGIRLVRYSVPVCPTRWSRQVMRQPTLCRILAGAEHAGCFTIALSLAKNRHAVCRSWRVRKPRRFAAVQICRRRWYSALQVHQHIANIKYIRSFCGHIKCHLFFRQMLAYSYEERLTQSKVHKFKFSCSVRTRITSPFTPTLR